MSRLDLPGTSHLQGFAAILMAQNDENLCLLQVKCQGPGPCASVVLRWPLLLKQLRL